MPGPVGCSPRPMPSGRQHDSLTCPVVKFGDEQSHYFKVQPAGANVEQQELGG